MYFSARQPPIKRSKISFWFCPNLPASRLTGRPSPDPEFRSIKECAHVRVSTLFHDRATRSLLYPRQIAPPSFISPRDQNATYDGYTSEKRRGESAEGCRTRGPVSIRSQLPPLPFLWSFTIPPMESPLFLKPSRDVLP